MFLPDVLRRLAVKSRVGEDDYLEGGIDDPLDPSTDSDLEQLDDIGAAPQDSDANLAQLVGADPGKRLKPSQIDEPNDIEDPEPVASMQHYLEVAGRRPNREDYKSGTAQKLLAGLAGAFTALRDPSAGVKLTQGILDRGYNEDKSDWESDLDNAKTAAQLDVTTQKPGIERAKLVETVKAKTLELRARMDAIKQREQDSIRDYDAALKNASNGADRNAIASAHNKAMEAISKERASIAQEAVDVQKRVAGAREASTAAYVVGQALKPLELAGRYKGRPPSATERIKAHQEAVRRAVAGHPEWSDFLGDDEKNPEIGPVDGWLSDTPIPPELEAEIKRIEESILAK